MIRKLPTLMLAGLLVACAHTPASAPATQAKPYTSPLGFSVLIPDDWMILSQAELQKVATQLTPDNPKVASMGEDRINALRRRIEDGSVEYYLSLGPDGKVPANEVSNINVVEQPGAIPEDTSEVGQTCDELPGDLSAQTHTEIKFQQCGLEKVASLEALHIVSTGRTPGAISIQYMIQRPDNTILVFTGTFNEKRAPALQVELEAMMQSLKLIH